MFEIIIFSLHELVSVVVANFFFSSFPFFDGRGGDDNDASDALFSWLFPMPPFSSSFVGRFFRRREELSLTSCSSIFRFLKERVGGIDLVFSAIQLESSESDT